ncbi:hypothetical protein SAMN05421767_1161 [Granulicatella balaenopterae]|uniref:YolD-like protein n=1 Tax=Granulicatella balaenopterae TaxID=137733 RepID=A0A1H9KWZ6_9LACT|nr:hypothetical protein [Granulicatella balaenopterae]SER03529.1 hypothetical protein SAMN05421767_1161 [Granulicatella balaenopterae]
MNNYQDRGMKKWQGFFLSEHSEQLAEKEEPLVVLEEQSDDEKSRYIYDAWRKNLPILVQLRMRSVGGDVYQFHGKVEGLLDDRIVFQKDGRWKSYQLASIEAVRVQASQPWFVD